MPISRKQILRGPCQVQYGGQTSYSKGDVIVTITMKTANLISSAIGLVDYTDDDVDAEIVYTPDGQATSELLPIYFPFIQSGIYPGASVFGNSDRQLVIWTRDGQKHIFNNAAVTKQPQIIRSATKTLFGAITFRALRSDATAWSGANSLASIVAADYPGDANFNLNNIIVEPTTGQWLINGAVPSGSVSGSGASPDVFTDAADHGLQDGDTVIQSGFADSALNGTFTVASVPTSKTYTLYQLGTTTPVDGSGSAEAGGAFIRNNSFDSFDTEGGFTIDTNVTLHEETSDTLGVIDMTFQQIEVTAKAIVIGPTPNDVISAMRIQGSGAARGASRSSKSGNLILAGIGLNASLVQASLVSIVPVRAGMATKRLGEVTWKTTMALSDNAPTPPLTLTLNEG